MCANCKIDRLVILDQVLVNRGLGLRFINELNVKALLPNTNEQQGRVQLFADTCLGLIFYREDGDC